MLHLSDLFGCQRRRQLAHDHRQDPLEECDVWTADIFDDRVHQAEHGVRRPNVVRVHSHSDSDTMMMKRRRRVRLTTE
jgi:hypothetical protein